MQGNLYSTGERLAERDLRDLADLLAMRLHERLGERVYMLSRGDVAELISPYVHDLCREDRRAIPWLIWHLFQDALELASQ